MDIQNYQEWVTNFYKKKKWYDYNPFIRVNFLCEEVGEVARAVRAIEIGRDRPDEHQKASSLLMNDLEEEIGDVLDSLFILADKYNISLESIMSSHKEKLINRYNNE